MKWWRRRFYILLAIVVGIPLLIGIALAVRFLPNRPVTYANIEDHFKYGSTGGYANGFPYWIWKAMPVVFKNRLPKYYPYAPGREYEAFGLIYEPGHDLPIGIQKGRNMGIDRVFLTCSICHHSTVREKRGDPGKVYLGMPAARFDIGAFQKFLMDVGTDDRFNADTIVPEIERQAGRLSLLDRYLVYPIAIALMQQRLVFLQQRLAPTRPETFGPGRNDTFNPEKGLWGFFNAAHPTERELYGLADFPSIWNQRMKRGMQLHWDGNNDDVTYRNKNAAFASGTTPATVDLAAMDRLVQWNWDLKAPAYPFPIDQALAAQGAPVYKEHCAYCHGANGQDFSGPYVGKVTPIEEIRTDRHRLDSFTYDIAVNLGQPYAGEPYRFKHFRKTYGYANMPLDGIWLRAPYLHNGSVPTLRDLLKRPEERPELFYRGDDLYDPLDVGFVSTEKTEGGRTYFPYDKNAPGNGNGGHLYGIGLSEAEKNALLEFLKTF
jgi:mono/diheme cytochrome c family protein